MILCAGKPSALVVCLRNDGVSMIYADFRTGIDTVLSFPEFYQPGSAAIIEINRKGVKNHLKTRRHIVIEPGVPGLFLPSVCCGGKDAAVAVEAVAERVYQFFEEGTFGTAVHGTDFTDDFFPVTMKKDTAEKGQKK